MRAVVDLREATDAAVGRRARAVEERVVQGAADGRAVFLHKPLSHRDRIVGQQLIADAGGRCELLQHQLHHRRRGVTGRDGGILTQPVAGDARQTLGHQQGVRRSRDPLGKVHGHAEGFDQPDQAVAEILEDKGTAEAVHLAAEVSGLNAERVTHPLPGVYVAVDALEPHAAAVGDFGRLKDAGLVAPVGHGLDAGLCHLGGLHGGSTVQNLEQLGLAGLTGLFLGDCRLDPLSLRQQVVVLGLTGLSRPLHRGGHGFVAFHRRLLSRLSLLLLEHAHFGEGRGEFVEQFLDFAGGHACGSCVR